jgi:hypothetical protein
MSWLDLLNFMRIFRQGAGKSGPGKPGFGIERAVWARALPIRRSATFLKTTLELQHQGLGSASRLTPEP